MRLQVFLSHSRVCSRRKALELIKDAQVTVNGKIVNEPSYSVDSSDQVYLGNKKVSLKENSYLILNKPRGAVTTLQDEHAKFTVKELLPKEYKHLYPVGRLDKESEGLLLITNDGDLAFRLGHPSFKVNKVYFVEVDRRLSGQDALALERGVVVEGRRTHPAKLRMVYSKPNASGFNLTIHEGRKRQIRLMLAGLGYSVRNLKRIQYGPIRLDNLAPGKCRLLSREELGVIFKVCGKSAVP
ncbi:MAG: hypothetical protein A2321_01655 [Omnitrophica WOR_2 bacterium RIFOXYB2_FULL_45_11]|nr:MAG: hypothetical protein A2321_01655 [Omnitrophica WOR_2 bacterium RIFOXYB2_FULL_45_11]